jgi:hypothetical protein
MHQNEGEKNTMNKRKVAIFVAALILLLGTTVAVQAATGTLGIFSWFLEGASNAGKACADLDNVYADAGTTWTEFKLEQALGNLGNGTWGDGTLEVTISNYSRRHGSQSRSQCRHGSDDTRLRGRWHI